jgi:dTDP-4-amino-4,6-dideoxygalactose transaminase
MNEFEAAMGLCMLDEMENILQKCKAVSELYEKELDGLVQMQKRNKHATCNYSYFPVVFKSAEERAKVQSALNEEQIFPRRYFYPSLDSLHYIEPKQFMPVSRDIAERILTLPLYPELEMEDQQRIIDTIKVQLVR